jgi:hypothetical protein
MVRSEYHGFYVEDAVRYGLKSAILLRSILLWIRFNRSDGRNFHDGRTWTYNTEKTLRGMFPYMSGRTITRALDSLVKKGVLVKGRFNKHKYDRTTWYALKNEGDFIESDRPFVKMTKAIEQNDETIPSSTTSRTKQHTVSNDTDRINNLYYLFFELRNRHLNRAEDPPAPSDRVRRRMSELHDLEGLIHGYFDERVYGESDANIWHFLSHGAQELLMKRMV